jgi:PAS domain-containing protein
MQAYIDQKNREWKSQEKDNPGPFSQKLLDDELSVWLREKMKFLDMTYGRVIFGEIFITNRYGANVAQSGMTTDYRQDDEEWWQAAKENSLFIGDISFDESADIYSISIGVRIDDEAGNFIGVLKGVVSFEGMLDIVRTSTHSGLHEEHQKMDFKIITNTGKLLFSKNREYPLMSDVSFLLSKGHISPGPGHERKFSEIKKPEGGEQGDSIIVAYAYPTESKYLNTLNWIFVVEQSADELFAPVDLLKKRVLIFSLAVTIIGILMGFTISLTFSRSIDKLGEVTSRIGMGELDAKVGIKSKDEFGRLARSIEGMAEDLKTTTVHRNELAREIEERKHAEEQLFQSQQEWEDTFNTITDMITVHDKDYNIIRANKAAEKFLKLPDLRVNKVVKCFKYYHGTDCPPQGCPSCDCYKTGKPASFELFEPHLNMFIEIRAIARFDDNNQIIGLIHIVRDITEQKRIEEVVKRGKAEWEMTVDNANELIALVNEDSRIIRSNKSFADFVKMSVQDIIGLKITDFLPLSPEQLKPEMPATKIEVMTVNKEWLYLSYCPILDEKDNFYRAVIIGTDVTNLKYTEQKLLASEEELQKRIDDLEKFYEMAIGREIRMKDLKKEITKLKAELSGKKVKNA